MSEPTSVDPRCCGSGTCIIDPEGRCWCGQQWNGEKMATPPLTLPAGRAVKGDDQAANTRDSIS